VVSEAHQDEPWRFRTREPAGYARCTISTHLGGMCAVRLRGAEHHVLGVPVLWVWADRGGSDCCELNRSTLQKQRTLTHCGQTPTVTMAYVSDCALPVNSDALLLVNGLKNIGMSHM
jgi:hypothetical protein